MLFLLLVVLHQGVSIQGTVRESGSLEPVPFALIEATGLGRSAVADEEGHFILADVGRDLLSIRISAPGYAMREINVQIESPATLLDVFLAPQPIEVSGIAATGSPSAGMLNVGPPTVRIDAASILTQPSVGEADVFRTIQALPSASPASDFSTALYVRGGAPDQTLILLDGAPLFNPFHLGGMFAAIDPYAISALTVTPGAFPSSFGDRLSAGIEIVTRDGGRDRIRGHGALGLLSSQAALDGPLPGRSGSFAVSVRRTYLDAVTAAAEALNLIPSSMPYGFTDAHLKLTHDLPGDGLITMSGYVNAEGITDPEVFDGGDTGNLAWGSHTLSFSFRQPLPPRMLIRVRAATSGFHATGATTRRLIPGQPPVPVIDGSARMGDALVGGDISAYFGAHRISVGGQVDRYRFDYDIRTNATDYADLFPTFRREDRFRTAALYLSDQWTVNHRLRLRAGLRAFHAGTAGADSAGEWALLPRAGLTYLVSPELSLSVGGGRAAQAVRSLRNEESLFASLVAYDLLAGPGGGPLATATDLVVGVDWSSRRGPYRIQAYTKRLHDLRLPPVPADLVAAPLLAVETDFLKADGTATGIELTAAQAVGRFEISGSYAISGLRYHPHQGDFAGFTPRFHRTHSINFEPAVRVGEHGLISWRLAVASGQPYTPVDGVHVPIGSVARGEVAWGIGPKVFVLADYNSGRLPGYWRLDVAARTRIEDTWFGRTVTLRPYVQVINLVATRNVLHAEPTQYNRVNQVRYGPQLPILPTLGLEWRF